jgi:hypothetical protein
MPPPTYPRARQNRSRRLAGADHLSPHAPDAFRARVANDAPTRTRTAGLTRKLRLGAQPPPQRHPHRRAGPSASWPACRCQRPEREGRSASTYRGSAPLDVAGCTRVVACRGQLMLSLRAGFTSEASSVSRIYVWVPMIRLPRRSGTWMTREKSWHGIFGSFKC